MKKKLNEQCSCAVSNCLESMSMISVFNGKEKVFICNFHGIKLQKKTKLANGNGSLQVSTERNLCFSKM